ncbi:MAG TPA: nucleotide exchange factor GrpE [Ktedonobacteraceae bacterium]
MRQDNQDEKEREGPLEVSSQPEQAEEAFVVESDEIEQQLRAEQQKAEEYLDLLRRTQADFINYRRRMTQEQAETRTTAQISLLKQLLPILDDFERAVDVTPENLAQDPWVQGLLFIARRLTTLLDQLGVSQVGEQGEQFDPRLHEAITMEVRPGVPEGTILQVVRSGYMLGDRVIRPAQVVVAGAPSPVSGASTGQ